MKKKNGFTLVELLAVIVILGIVLLITVPGVLALINKSKEDAYQSQLNIIKQSTKNYLTGEHAKVTWYGDDIKTTVVSLKTLQESGYLESKVIDPRTKKPMSHLAVRIISPPTGSRTYEIVYTDSSDAIYPTYQANMIPIRYDGTKWVKADASNQNQDWFDYSKQQWANIATVTESTRDAYKTAKTGTEVKMSDIDTMFTWIPRYKYKLWNVDGTQPLEENPNLAGDHLIDVKFESINEDKSTGTQNGQWLTHPAFTLGDQELNGMWVGKYISSSKEGNECANNYDTCYQDNKIKTIQIKKENEMWHHIDAANMYRNARNMAAEKNPFGITAANEPHQMKNIEWGALAYLSYSVYGKAGNPNYTGNSREVGGYQYTTGNETGVMTALYELTSTVMYNKTKTGLMGTDVQGRTQEEIDAILNGDKYIDIYDFNASYTDRSAGHLGDATIETGPFTSITEANGHIELNNAWYNDDATFIIASSPNFLRSRHCYNGGSYGITAFCPFGGYTHPNVSFRIVLV